MKKTHKILRIALLLFIVSISHALMSQTFTHPGILHKESDFARMREKIAKHEEPWYSTWNNLLNSRGSSLSFYRGVPTEIYRPSTGTQAGPVYLYENAQAAYQNALIYRISGNQAHADKAVALLNEQAAKNTYVGGNADRFLAGGLFGYQFANAAEMMRGYPGFDEAQFKKYLTDVFMYPLVGQFLFAINGGSSHNGSCCTNYRVNWDACNMAAAAAIAIFCDNKEWYDMSINYFKNNCGNGNISRAVNFIQPGENGEPDLGQWEESGRDQGHTAGGLAEMGLFLEMAWNQGDDLFSYDDSRYRKGAEYVSKYNIMENGVGKYILPYTTYSRTMGTTCTWYTESTLGESGRGARSSYISQVLNHYLYRQKVPVAQVKYMAESLPGKYSGNYDGGFEGTHTDNYDQPGFGNLTYTLDSTSSVLPWLDMNISARSIALLSNYGKTTLTGSTLTIKGSGTGVNGSSDFCQFAFQRLYEDGSIVTKMSSLDEVNAFCQSGLMMRESLEQNSANVFLSLSAARGAIFCSRDVAGEATSNIASNSGLKTVPCWLRLSRAGNVFTAFVSSDNINWVVVGSKTLNLNRNLYVGMAVSSNTQNSLCTAVFENPQFTQANMKPVIKFYLPDNGTTYIAPAYVTIGGEASDIDGTLSKVEIYVNGSLVSTTSNSPFYYSMSGVAGGSYSFYVKAYDAQGAVQTSDTVTYTVNVKTTKLPWYKFDETQTSTNVSDASGNNQTATLYGGPVYTTGRINSCIKLDGVDDHVKLPNGLIEQLSDFSVSTWVNPDSVLTWSRIFDFGSSTKSNMFLTGFNQNGKMQFSLTTEKRGVQTAESTTALPTKTWSLVTVTLSGDVLKLYLNGSLVGSTSNFVLRPYDLVVTTSNYIGKSQWPDPFLKGSIDNFRLYNYALSSSEIATLAAEGSTPPAIVANLSGSTLALDDLNTTGSFTVSGLNLTNNIAITAPTGITVNPTSVASNASNVTVTVTYDGTTTPINGNIVLTSGSATQTVAVNAQTRPACFTPLYSTGNIIVDPTCSSYNTDGWGTKGINSNFAYVYCGDKSGMIGGGSYDRVLTGVMKTNTKYRVKAKVFKTGGTVGVGVYGWNGTAADIYKEVTNAWSWQDVDFTFATGATLKSSGQGVYFNYGYGYIDNWEMYEVPGSIFSASSLSYTGAGTKKVAVTGSKLTSTISITAPAGLTVSPATLPATATGDSIAITFDGNYTTNGYVYLISGSAKDSIQIAAAAYPAIATSLDSLKFGELNAPGSFTVTGRNLINDITITVPTGITVNSPIIPLGSASNATLSFTYDGTTPLTGNIILTSGSAVKNVAVSAVAHALCYTPLYPTGNKIADPYLNSLATYAGWGTKSINTDPTYVFCGTKDGKITGRCGGSIDYNLTGKIQGNRTYRVKAMVSTNGTGTVKIGISGATATNITQPISTSVGQWLPVDFTFTTQSTITSVNMYFNSCETQTATVGYIDNWEMYEVPKMMVSSASLNYLGASTKKVAITAINLGNNISISTPDGFTVLPSTLLSTVTGDSITIAFDGLVTKNGYAYLTSGSVKDSIQLLGRALPTMTTSPSSLVFDELNATGSFTVSGTDILSNIAITAPTGITVSPTTIQAGMVSNVAVSVTYNGSTPVNGNIALNCGGTVKNVAVNANTNASCFTPLYPSGNLIVDPTCNYYTTDGWGNKSINTDPAFVYCGARSGKITSTGSLDRALTGVMKTNTLYRVKAKVWKVSGTVGVGVYGWNGNAADIYNAVATAGSWQDVDFTFTTGATLKSSGQGVYFNSGNGYIDNWEMYEVPLPTMTTSVTSLSFDDLHTTGSFTVSGTNQTSSVTIAVPAGITVSPTSIAGNPSNVTVSVTYDGATLPLSGNIALTSSGITKNVAVSSCFAPVNASGNLIPDPKMNSLAGFTQKWGATSIATGSEAYCGVGSGKVTGTGICWPNGGSIATPNITWAKNTICRVRAMVKTVSGSFTIGLINSYPSGGSTSNFFIPVSTSNTWMQIDTTFTIGANATIGYAYFGNCDGATGLVGYIDNWEIYNSGALRSPSLRTGLDDSDATGAVNIYKNENNLITIYCSNVIDKEGVITVHNTVGQTLVNIKTTGTITVINRLLKPGVYIVTLNVDGKNVTKKVML